MVDLCTKFVKLRPYGEASADNILAGLDEWTQWFGFPQFLLTDNAQAFVGKKLNDWLKENGVRRREIPPHTPQCNGTCERVNQEVLRRLRRMSINGKWVDLLPKIESFLKTHPNQTLNLNAYQMPMGYTLHACLV